MIAVVKARPEHAALLAPRLRAEDREEAALYPCSPEEGLRASIELPGWAEAAFDGDTILALYGVAQVSGVARPWLMASEAFQGHARAFLRLARFHATALRAQGGPCWNFIGKQSHSNKRFVEAHGFIVKPLSRGPFDIFTLP